VKTISEKILSEKSGTDAHAGDIVICRVDWVLGTDGSAPMAIDYFNRMGGERLFDPSRVIFAMDHYSPPSSAKTAGFHDTMRAFATRYGNGVREVGDGISFQLLTEEGRALPGDLVVGADSHTVTCGALNLFAAGVGSSDLAAAMITGRIWLRVPESIKVTLTGTRARGVGAKDLALSMLATLGSDGASYKALEFHGPALADFPLEDRLVFSNIAVEADAKASIFPGDDQTRAYLAERATRAWAPMMPDPDARYAREITIDVGTVSPQIAMPHTPDRVVPIEQAAGIPVDMVFIGTCTGGRVRDFHEALAILKAGGGRLAPGVHLVITPASREVQTRLLEDGTLRDLAAMGAVITTPGCGACCGTSGAIPGDGMTVLSTANRNFKGRMGNATASIYLASPAACAAAALTGRITDPR
jgi:3-isopropylmalate/(R)-2-methylmalate dehydratase large subunit